MTIDLTQLPAPAVVEDLDFETIYAGKLARFQSLYPDYTAALESDPVVKLLELSAYDEMMYRARVNDAARATMLAYATGTDLDNRAADYGVSRLLITPADPDATPPTEAAWEDDDRLRYRCQMALEGLSVAGSSDAYEYHALTASALVAGVQVDSPTPGIVRITVLAAGASGIPDAALLGAVQSALSGKRVRPLTDTVQVRAAEIVTYRIRATLTLSDGPDPEPVLAAANAAAGSMAVTHRKLASGVPLSAVYAALHQPGVTRVQLIEPAADLPAQDGVAYICTGIELEAA
ncbi:MAG: baseplate J/gp47 family protein [Pseudogulbenkiania sp.]|nr:baseplate J/gp47 family protein [Pseudogulbenkiania sp.]